MIVTACAAETVIASIKAQIAGGKTIILMIRMAILQRRPRDYAIRMSSGQRENAGCAEDGNRWKILFYGGEVKGRGRGVRATLGVSRQRGRCQDHLRCIMLLLVLGHCMEARCAQ